MPCCGDRRRSLAGSTPFGGAPTKRRFFRYDGQTALTVAGPVSGKHYRFPAPGATVECDPRDAPSLARVPLLREV